MIKYTEELHNRLRQLDKDASPAPWVADEEDDQRYLCAKGYEVITSYAEHVYEIDAQASVESRNALPLLLDGIEELEKKNIDSTGGESV